MPPNNSSRTSLNDKVEKGKDEMKVKVYAARDSILTEITKEKHILTVYRIFVMVFLTLLINFVFHNYFYGEGVFQSFALITRSFRQLHIAVIGWGCSFLSTLAVYFGFKSWAKGRTLLIPNSFSSNLWNKLWLLAYFIHFVSVLYIPTWFIYRYDLGVASSLALGIDTMRLLMKAYAVVRSNTPRLMRTYLMKEFPKFSHYLYFLFSPAMVYRDSYPRSKQPIRWKYVGVLLAEFVMIVLLCVIVFERSYINDLKNYGLTPYRWTDLVTIVLENCFYSILMFVVTFYLVLHVSQNLFAEILQFSDKMFYEDWWTSSSYARYYRTWNVVIHDWLYHYIYKDMYEIVWPKNKFIAKQTVFFLSALFHDYITAVAVGFCVPIFMIMFFGAGNYMSYHKFPNSFVGNLFLMYSLALGSSIMFASMTMEYNCRANSATQELTLTSFFTPKLFSCMSY